MSELSQRIQLRVHYGEADQMGACYHARALDGVLPLMIDSRPGPNPGVTT